MTHIWLRAESKPNERRSALTPSAAKALIDAGYQVTVERCQQRIFPISDYQQVGAQIADSHQWPSAPADAIILGLKELSSANTPLTHRHIHFAHVYKEQRGWQSFLNRFQPGALLWDLEYLVDDNHRRIAAFGHWAGFAGAALALKSWALQQQRRSLGAVNAYDHQSQLVDEVATELSLCERKPTLLVIGAKGRSGRGAVAMANAVGAKVIEWDLAETQSGGPFPAINQADILVNCVLVNQDLPPFVTREMLSDPLRQLSVIADVSCDPYGDYNPLPIYDHCTNFVKPQLRLIDGDNPLDLIAIDHLPSMLPRESSDDYVSQLLPYLLTLDSADSGVWTKAEALYYQKQQQAKLTMPQIHWLGAGLSSIPGIARLAKGTLPLTVWNRTQSKAEQALGPLTKALTLKQLDWDTLVNTIKPGDVLVSMLPATEHLKVANLCLEKQCHFVSSSYVAPEMAALNDQAKAANLTFINEVGLDPGIDHLLAHALMHDYQSSDKFNPSHQHYFRSYCGGFPKVANDFKYKFSWSPLGVLRALKSPAQWLQEGQVANSSAPWDALSEYHAQLPQGNERFQAYPNRDSLPFASEYGFGDDWDLQQFVRGTLRLDGWSTAWQPLFDEVGSLSGEQGEARLRELSQELETKYSYDAGEPDRVVLCVELQVKSAGETLWHQSYNIDACGNDNGSAMARLVSLPVSLAIEAVVAGELPAGVSPAPKDNATVRRWLNALAELGETVHHKDHLDG